MGDREADGSGGSADSGPIDSEEPAVSRSLRETVEAKYDFDDFGPADMAEMSVEEWEAAFDPDTWISGLPLIDRIEDELRNRIVRGDLFAVVERHSVGGDSRLLIYTDAEYTIVFPDGRVEGDGAISREVEPVVALCSMDSYEVSSPPPDAGLPEPASIEPGSGGLGHRLLLTVAAIHALAGVALVVSPLFLRLGPGTGALTTVLGALFIGIGIVLGVLVANARLSDRFRATAFRDRLEAAGVGSDERPDFLPPMEAGERPSELSESDRS